MKATVETIEICCHLFLLLFIPPALYLITIGRRICTHKAVPYPGMKVIRDTVIIRGKKAVFRGKSLIVLGTVLVVLVGTSMVATHFILVRFKQHPLFRPVFYGVEE